MEHKRGSLNEVGEIRNEGHQGREKKRGRRSFQTPNTTTFTLNSHPVPDAKSTCMMHSKDRELRASGFRR